MNDETLRMQADILDAFAELGISITGIELQEFIRGDPTLEDSETTGAEIQLTAYVSYESENGSSE